MKSKANYLVVICIYLLSAALVQGFASEQEATALKTLSQHIHYLAADELGGREAGSEEANLAARYIASQFLRLGLQPFGDMPHAGDDSTVRSFMQTFTVPLAPQIGNESFCKWIGGAASEEKYAIIPLPFSTAGEAQGNWLEISVAEIEAASSEKSTSANTSAMQNKIIVIATEPDFAPNPHGVGMLAWAKACQKFAAKALLIRGTQAPEKVAALFTGQPTVDCGIPVAWVAQTAWQKQQEILFVQTDIRREKAQTANVLALLPGSDSLGETIVIGAHYDHLGKGGEGSREPGSTEIHNGADDNASGVVALFEIANQLNAQADSLRRNILFAAWSGEEKGLLGSAYFMKHLPLPKEKIVANLNLDMVGRLRENKLDIGGVGTQVHWEKVIESANQKPGLNIKLSQTAMGFGGSDHLSFFQENVPVLFFFTGLHEDYHKSTDDVERLNVQGIYQIAQLTAAIASEIANTQEPMTFIRPPEPEQRGGSGKMAWFGTIPEYGDYQNGVPLSGTTPGSPAETAGLQKGDVLIQLGNVQIKTIYDFTFALRQYKPDDTVEVVWMRAGKNISKQVTLGSR